jgi:hypothetical protein
MRIDFEPPLQQDASANPSQLTRISAKAYTSSAVLSVYLIIWCQDLHNGHDDKASSEPSPKVQPKETVRAHTQIASLSVSVVKFRNSTISDSIMPITRYGTHMFISPTSNGKLLTYILPFSDHVRAC